MMRNSPSSARPHWRHASESWHPAYGMQKRDAGFRRNDAGVVCIFQEAASCSC